MGVVIALAILFVTAFLFSLELKRRRHAEARLQEALASVEQQVSDRTDALSRAMAELKLSEKQFRLITDLSLCTCSGRDPTATPRTSARDFWR